MKKFCARCNEERASEAESCPECGGALAVIKLDDLSGTTLDDRYEIMELIGKGGMGYVYRAKQQYLDREVALKVLRKEVSEETTHVKRFLQEAKAASRLQSPHTVTVFDFGITPDGQMYFTMELLPGEPLSARLDRDGTVPWKEAAEFVIQTCRSLSEAHVHQIWHRDIKPDNLFVVPDGHAREIIKVLDFGIAKFSSTDTTMTKSGMVCGTPVYLSPEQAKGSEIDHRVDLYSLGVVLYEMLSGVPPFQADTGVKTLMCHVLEDPPPLPRKARGMEIPSSIARIAMWCLSKDPASRPATADVLAEAVRAAIEKGEYVGPRHITPSRATMKPVEPGPSGAMVSGMTGGTDFVPVPGGAAVGIPDVATESRFEGRVDEPTADSLEEGPDSRETALMSEEATVRMDSSRRFSLGAAAIGALALVALAVGVWVGYPYLAGEHPPTGIANVGRVLPGAGAADIVFQEDVPSVAKPGTGLPDARRLPEIAQEADVREPGPTEVTEAGASGGEARSIRWKLPDPAPGATNDVRDEDVRNKDKRKEEVRNKAVRKEEVRNKAVRKEEVRKEEVRKEEVRKEDERKEEVRNKAVRKEGVRKEDERKEDDDEYSTIPD